MHELVLDLWRAHKPAVLMVTHDVDEAVFLADRVVVMRPRPGRVHETLAVDLPRPRDRRASVFDLMKQRVMRAIDRSLAEERLAAPGSGQGTISPWI